VERRRDFSFYESGERILGELGVLDRRRNFVRSIDRVEFTVHRGAAGGFGLGGLGYPLIS
jgi:hypothetical protein